MLAIAMLLAVAADEAAPNYTGWTEKGNDACIACEGRDGLAFLITSRTGIGGAEVTSRSGRWPEKVVFRFERFRNLESFGVSVGALSAGRGGGWWAENKAERDFTAGAERTADGIEVTVIPSPSAREAKTWSIRWIDAYRR